MPARRILLLSIIALLLIYNLWHFNRARHPGTKPAPPDGSSVIANGLWNDYQNAASVRDGNDAEFQNALTTLQNARNSVSNPNLKSNAEILSDLRGCTTWLLFYRQTVNNPHPDPTWRERSLEHIQSCSKNHADIAR